MHKLGGNNLIAKSERSAFLQRGDLSKDFSFRAVFPPFRSFDHDEFLRPQAGYIFHQKRFEFPF